MSDEACLRISRAGLVVAVSIMLSGLVLACRGQNEAATSSSGTPSPTAVPMLRIVTPTPGGLVPPDASAGGSGTGQPDASGNPAANVPEGAYLVQPGDTLFAIALRFKVTIEALMEANGITDPAALRAGQILVIPPQEGQ